MMSRLRTWLGRSGREWLLVLERRFVPNPRRTVRLRNGLLLTVRLTDELAPGYVLGREFEPETVGLLEQYLRAGDTVLDVGANIGHLTVVAGTRVGPEGRVFAFEPSPAEFRELTRNVELNRLENTAAVPMAIVEAPGTVTLHLAGPGLGLYNSTGRPFRSEGAASVEVPATSLDRFVAERGLSSIALVKLDVEGGECAALRGGPRLFGGDDAPLLVCEFSDVASVATGQTTGQLWRLLTDLGYSLHSVRPVADRWRLVPATPQAHYDYENLVGVKKIHHERLRLCDLM